MNQEKNILSIKRNSKNPSDLTRSVLDQTWKASAKTAAFTQSLIEKSKTLRTPSPAGDRIGTKISGIVSAGLLVVGAVQFLTSKPLWGLGTVSFGAISLLSNRYHAHKIKVQK